MDENRTKKKELSIQEKMIILRRQHLDKLEELRNQSEGASHRSNTSGYQATPRANQSAPSGHIVLDLSAIAPVQATVLNTPQVHTSRVAERVIPPPTELAVPPAITNRPPQPADNKRTVNTTKKPASDLSPIRTATNITGIRNRSKSATGMKSFIERDTLEVNGVSYSIIRILGKGASCKVYECIREDTNETFAVKVVDMSEGNALKTAYHKEIDLLKLFPITGRVIYMFDHEWRHDQDVLYLVLEKGDTDFFGFLNRRVKDAGVDALMIQFYWSEMLKCVKAIHERGIVHSDLKPANFLLVKGQLKLIDFGIASLIPREQTSIVKESASGTLSFMSPEAISSYSSDMSSDEIDGEVYKVTLKSDIWSLGVILYKMVYGYMPFNQRDQRMKMTAIIKGEIQFEDHTDSLVLDTMKLCLERDVQKRASIDDLLNHPYLRVSAGRPTTPVFDHKAFVEDIKENTPNTICRKVAALMLSNNGASTAPKPLEPAMNRRLEFED